jgi:hypothetical protein
MKKIQLTQNKVALVDDEDFAYLNQWKWCCDTKGYAVRSEKRSETGVKKRALIRMHRVIAKTPADKLTDHINGNILDNRKANLRHATDSENMRNRKMAANNKTGYKGVWFNKKTKKYVAYIKLQHSRVLGSFDKAEEAAYVYDQFALQIFGKFARTNLL